MLIKKMFFNKVTFGGGDMALDQTVSSAKSAGNWLLRGDKEKLFCYTLSISDGAPREYSSSFHGFNGG